MHENGDSEAASGPILIKHPKLELPQRVEHDSTPQKCKIRRISAQKRDFLSKSAPRRGKMGVNIGSRRVENGTKWSKMRFYQIGPKSVSDGGKPVLGTLGG